MTKANKTDLSPGDAGSTGLRVSLTPCAKRVRIKFGGETVADTLCPLLLRESGRTPVYYIPKTDVRKDFLEPSDRSTFNPVLGYAVYWSLGVGEHRQEDAAWSYENPGGELSEIRDHLAFSWGQIDHWLEEDEEIFVHPRDPFVRIDILESHRAVRVVIGDETVAQTTRARFLFETNLPVRYYIPPDDVRWDLFDPSGKSTACPYKGIARYWSARAGGIVTNDIAWSYPNPLPECARIKEYLCFYNELVTAIFIDGEAADKPPMRENWL
ncbi:MAG: DUF427 domain-containing protein [Rhodospirillales bacterium]|nr:DUF427 domain-containing protein [Rhodospirillales bacterium]